MQLLHYRLSDGVIIGVWTASNREVLDANRGPADGVHSYLFQEEERDARALCAHWRVRDGMVCAQQ